VAAIHATGPHHTRKPPSCFDEGHSLEATHIDWVELDSGRCRTLSALKVNVASPSRSAAAPKARGCRHTRSVADVPESWRYALHLDNSAVMRVKKRVVRSAGHTNRKTDFSGSNCHS